MLSNVFFVYKVSKIKVNSLWITPTYYIQASWIKVRYLQMVLLFFLQVISYGSRTTLSVAIVAMVNEKTSSNTEVPTFDWTNTGVILSSFFWGYAVLQFFAGAIAQSFSPKWVLTVAMVINAGTCLLLPVLSIYLGSAGCIACRVIQGLVQGFGIPLTHAMLGKWAPTEERSWINTTVYSGCSVGTIMSMPITGYLSSSKFGWPASFYLFGLVNIVWCIFWVLYSADRPASHRSISIEEQKYIENSLGQEEEIDLKDVQIPWKAIFTSLPYWAVVIATIGEGWGGTFLITEVPTFLDQVTGVNIEENSIFSSAPYMVATLTTVLLGPIADFLIQKGYTSRKTSRRIFQALGSFVPSAALIWLAYEKNRTAIAILLIVAISSNAAMFCGQNVNHIDISPQFSGVLYGISNGIGQTIAILAPMLVQFVVYDPTDPTLWRIMFITAALIYSGTAAFFIVFLSAERQWWDSVRKPSRTDLELVTQSRNSEEAIKLQSESL